MLWAIRASLLGTAHFLGRAAAQLCSPHQPGLGSAAKPAEGSRHNDFAEAVGRERMNPTLTLVPLLLWR